MKGWSRKILVLSYCGRKVCSGSSIKRLLRINVEQEENIASYLSFLFEKMGGIQKHKHYFVFERHTSAHRDHSFTQYAPNIINPLL